MGVLEDIRENYPTLAFLVNDPEVGPLLRDAVDPGKGFSPQTFQAKLYQTKWFRSKSQTQREYDILSKTDPKTFNQNISFYRNAVRNRGIQLGLKPSEDQITWLAHAAMQQGLQTDDPIFTQWILGIKGIKRGMGAQLTATTTIKNMAQGEYYQPLGVKEANNWSNQVVMGNWTMDDVKAQLQARAIKRFPHLQASLKAGYTMNDIFGQHKATIAQELEVPENSVNLYSPQWSKIIDSYDPKTKQHRAMTLTETTTLARSDPRYWKTFGGQEKDATMANFMAKTFGKRS
jgi:hypothetical protein